MMKRKLLALVLSGLLCLGLVIPAYGAVEELVDLRIEEVVAYSQEEGVYTVMQNGLYGFYRTDGTQLLPPEYAAAGEFSGGMAAVSLSGEWSRVRTAAGEIVPVLRGGRFGYVDANGALLVPMRYSQAYPYAGGRAFAVDAASGVLVLLDELGQEVASFPEAEIPEGESIRFSEGLAVLPVRRAPQDDEIFEIEEVPESEEESEILTEPEEADVSSEQEEEAIPLTYLVIDELGRERCMLTDAYVDYIGGYHNGRVAVAAEIERADTDQDQRSTYIAWGYRDEWGELAVEYRYASAAAFSDDGLAAVSVQSEQGGILWGFLSPEGQEVVPPQYEAVQPYADGFCAVCRNGLWAYVDRHGRMVTSFAYEEAGPFREGLALALRNGEMYAMDQLGQVVFTVAAVSGEPFSGGVTVLRQADGQCGVYDAEGGELVPFSYENAFHWDGYLWLKRGDLWRVYETAEVIAAQQAAPEGESVEVGAFVDVPSDSWYAAAVTWATDYDVITGTGGGQFSPDKPCTVGEILTFLWRAVGRPEPEVKNPFTDVTPNHYYYQAALWAYERGLVAGDVFGAAALCDRSMAVTYLWRLDGAPLGALTYFTDVPPDAPYAQAVAWAVNAGVTSGSGGGSFAPQDICSRGQIVTFLYRYLTQE